MLESSMEANDVRASAMGISRPPTSCTTSLPSLVSTKLALLGIGGSSLFVVHMIVYGVPASHTPAAKPLPLGKNPKAKMPEDESQDELPLREREKPKLILEVLCWASTARSAEKKEKVKWKA